MQAGSVHIRAFMHIEHFLGVDVIFQKYYLKRKRHRITSVYVVTGWCHPEEIRLLNARSLRHRAQSPELIP
jgi:predicted RNA-binding protein